MSKILVTADIDNYDHESGEDMKLEIIIEYGPLNISFCPENSGNKEQWGELLNRPKNGQYCCIDWAPSNGDCCISIYNNVVTFNLSKRDGCGGEILIDVPMENCIEAFQYIYNAF